MPFEKAFVPEAGFTAPKMTRVYIHVWHTVKKQQTALAERETQSCPKRKTTLFTNDDD